MHIQIKCIIYTSVEISPTFTKEKPRDCCTSYTSAFKMGEEGTNQASNQDEVMKSFYRAIILL